MKETGKQTLRNINEKSGGMTPAEQRVAIARDALEWLGEGALIATGSTYGYPVNRHKDPSRCDSSVDPNTQLREVQMGPCKVCGRGPLFLAKAVRFDDVTVGDWNCVSRMVYEKLGRHFDRQQLEMIEVAFEMNPAFSYKLTRVQEDAAFHFWKGRRYDTTKR